jgi:hypothetical protein
MEGAGITPAPAQAGGILIVPSVISLAIRPLRLTPQSSASDATG